MTREEQIAAALWLIMTRNETLAKLLRTALVSAKERNDHQSIDRTFRSIMEHADAVMYGSTK